MENELAIYEAQVRGEKIDFRNKTLEECEQIVREELYEGFVRAGMAMEQINRGKLYRQAGFESFNQYVKSKRSPCQRTHAFQLINSASLRIKLGQSATADQWTERALRPYTRIQPQSQAVRLAKKAASIAAKEREDGKVTPKITKRVIQGHTGAMPKERRKKARALDLASTAREVVDIASENINQMFDTFKKFSAQMWDEAEADSPGCVKRLARELSDLASYLRS